MTGVHGPLTMVKRGSQTIASRVLTLSIMVKRDLQGKSHPIVSITKLNNMNFGSVTLYMATILVPLRRALTFLPSPY